MIKLVYSVDVVEFIPRWIFCGILGRTLVSAGIASCFDRSCACRSPIMFRNARVKEVGVIVEACYSMQLFKLVCCLI